MSETETRRTWCGAIWLEGIEGGCQEELGHPAEHHAKLKIFYGDEQIGEAEVWWVGYANLIGPSKEAGPQGVTAPDGP